MHQLLHNGILIPTQIDELDAMVLAWAQKLGTSYVNDSTFKKNFEVSFRKAISELPKGIRCHRSAYDWEGCAQILKKHIEEEKQAKLNWSVDQKKSDRLQRKALAEQNKLRYGYAIVDGVRTEIANYRAEPAGIFMGRGAHPKRGSWKAAVSAEEVILNLSPDAPMPAGFVNRVWEPDKCYIAKWRDKFSGKTKYIWFADSSTIRQSGDIEKYNKAIELLKNFDKVSTHIWYGVQSPDFRTRQVATCCYFIQRLGLRVGDEAEPDEAETLGATTLRVENIKFGKDEIPQKVTFDFLGKDSVRYNESIKFDPPIIRNLKDFIQKSKDGKLFGDINSSDINAFLSEVMPKLTAKVFRTALGTSLLKNFLDKHTPKDISGIAEYVKVLTAKYANLEAAKFLNHRRALPKNFEQSLKKKEEKLHHLLAEKKYEQADKLKAEIDFQAKASNFNLGTSMRSYLDPRVFMIWCKQVELEPEKVYSKTLLNKFSWSVTK